jgi:lipopolysaccharide transport system ATP-binding protein
MSSERAAAPVPNTDAHADSGASPNAIAIDAVGKCYRIFERPQDRLKQALRARIGALFGRSPTPLFREFWALRDISLTVARGETVGIIGRNGSGKSTLLQIVCGTLTPTQGRIDVNGRIGALLELGTGFNPEFTGRENVMMNATILGLSADEIRRKYDDIVAFAEIGDFIDQPVKTYSSGMYVRLAFAVIAHADADVLVIDEALSVGDVFFGQKCMRFLRDFQKRGTVLFVSHDSTAVTSLCDRAVWLEGGKVMMDGPAKQVCEAYQASTYGHLPTAAQGADAQSQATASEERAADEDDDAGLDRSEVRVFRFDPERAGFGDGGAKILSIRVEDEAGRPLVRVDGGEAVTLVIEAETRRAIRSPIIGFLFKDRLGQHLFGTNTYRENGDEPDPVAPGQHVVARFGFRMPYLPRGRYTVDAAIADGTYLNHVQADWVYDGLVLESTVSTMSTGLIGIPYRSIALAVHDGAPASSSV